MFLVGIKDRDRVPVGNVDDLVLDVMGGSD
jgi:hypothetical protein